MRRLILVPVCCLFAACSAARPPVRSPKPPEAAALEAAGPADPFYFIDGRTASRDAFEQLTHDDIDRILILIGPAAVDRYGPDAAGGAMLVTTRREAATAGAESTVDRKERIFYFIDGRTATRAEVEALHPVGRIQRIQILQGPAAITRFGPEAEAGAMLVSTKRSS